MRPHARVSARHGHVRANGSAPRPWTPRRINSGASPLLAPPILRPPWTPYNTGFVEDTARGTARMLGGVIDGKVCLRRLLGAGGLVARHDSAVACRGPGGGEGSSRCTGVGGQGRGQERRYGRHPKGPRCGGKGVTITNQIGERAILANNEPGEKRCKCNGFFSWPSPY